MHWGENLLVRQAPSPRQGGFHRGGDVCVISLRWTCVFLEIAILDIFSDNSLIILFFELFLLFSA